MHVKNFWASLPLSTFFFFFYYTTCLNKISWFHYKYQSERISEIINLAFINYCSLNTEILHMCMHMYTYWENELVILLLQFWYHPAQLALSVLTNVFKEHKAPFKIIYQLNNKKTMNKLGNFFLSSFSIHYLFKFFTKTIPSWVLMNIELCY